MQRYGKLFFLFCALLWAAFAPATAKPADRLLDKADSLFSAKQYTQAFLLYQQLLTKDRYYSPGMLLKMAYVKEALGDYVAALYYLQVYHQKHPGRRVLKKMEALAQQHELSGYEYSDYALFTAFVDKYYLKVLELLMMGGVIFLTLSVLGKWRGKKVTVWHLAGFGVYLLFLFYYLNFLSLGRYGIVTQDQLLLMSGPSAGSAVLETIPKGNRVQLLQQEDIWLQIRYRDQTAFARLHGIQPLPQ